MATPKTSTMSINMEESSMDSDRSTSRELSEATVARDQTNGNEPDKLLIREHEVQFSNDS